MKNSIKSTLLVSTIAFVVSGCGIQTATYGTGESVELGLARDIASLATFGALGKKKKGERITYNERGPLIVPTEQQFASIPEPVRAVDSVDDNFPGRAAELARIKRQEEKETNIVVRNQAIGDERTLALGEKLLKKKSDNPSADENAETKVANRDTSAPQINANIGAAVPIDVRELTKTPEEHAAERGVTVAELPPALQGQTLRERNLLERAGLIEPKRSSRSAPKLTDVPVEYRTVQQDPSDAEAQALLNPEKKKKKKRFLFF